MCESEREMERVLETVLVEWHVKCITRGNLLS